ncbi:hypothetical protein OC846_005611 [Tilletia horrida]|uniref:Noranthrone monooxygenase n=1 Tax=Tilletia horrida TaxID=155126 RepID=A0AAN6JPR0_9BASI|nr:hypothetical protein OC846_005611 [Tilletia horrida]
MTTCGVIKMVSSPQERQRLDINADRAVALWADMYEAGKKTFAPTALATAASFFVASLTVQNTSSAPQRELAARLFLASSLVSLTIVPFTIMVMLPNINPLIATRNRILAQRTKGELTILQGAEAEQALQGIQIWKRQNLARMAIGFVSMALGTGAAALLLQ